MWNLAPYLLPRLPGNPISVTLGHPPLSHHSPENSPVYPKESSWPVHFSLGIPAVPSIHWSPSAQAVAPSNSFNSLVLNHTALVLFKHFSVPNSVTGAGNTIKQNRQESLPLWSSQWSRICGPGYCWGPPLPQRRPLALVNSPSTLEWPLSGGPSTSGASSNAIWCLHPHRKLVKTTSFF